MSLIVAHWMDRAFSFSFFLFLDFLSKMNASVWKKGGQKIKVKMEGFIPLGVEIEENKENNS